MASSSCSTASDDIGSWDEVSRASVDSWTTLLTMRSVHDEVLAAEPRMDVQSDVAQFVRPADMHRTSSSLWEWGFQRMADMVTHISIPDFDKDDDSPIILPVVKGQQPHQQQATHERFNAAWSAQPLEPSETAVTVSSLLWHIASLIPSNINTLVNTLDGQDEVVPFNTQSAQLSRIEEMASDKKLPSLDYISSTSAADFLSLSSQSNLFPTSLIYARAASAIHDDAMDTLGVRTLGYRHLDYDGLISHNVDILS